MVDLQQQKQAEVLIARIDAEAAGEIARMHAKAEALASALIARTHSKARARVHNVSVEIRETERRETLRAQARIDTLRRQQDQAGSLAAISIGLPQLDAALVTLWAGDARRQVWVQNVFEAARTHLNVGVWRVEHPANWGGADQSLIEDKIQAHTGEKPRWVQDDTLKAGIRIWSDNACLDGSVNAILADQQEISALLLGELENGSGS